jgi:hypothetical protein
VSFHPKSPLPLFFKEGLEIPQRKIPPLAKGDEGGFEFDFSAAII